MTKCEFRRCENLTELRFCAKHRLEFGRQTHERNVRERHMGNQSVLDAPPQRGAYLKTRRRRENKG